MEKIRVGVVGFGGRGMFLMKEMIMPRENVEVTAVCDLIPERAQTAADAVQEYCGKRPLVTTDYRELTASKDVDAVVVSTSWEAHVEVSISAMENRKFTATEVAGAYSLNDCWRLVETYEKTGMHCMMLENCCYDRKELMVSRMVREGLFGDVMHCSGGYHHDVRRQIAHGHETLHYRQRNYMHRNCENYPTHELGPIAKILDVNRGNRMISLVSVGSAQRGIHEFIRSNPDTDQRLLEKRFAQSDVVSTIIRCAGGQTIALTLDTTLPHLYTRDFTVRGTRGMYEENSHTIFLADATRPAYLTDFVNDYGNEEKFRHYFEHPIWARFIEEGVHGGHGGIDWLEFDAFFGAIERGIELPIDTYDTAARMAITPLYEASLATGLPVDIPDFTRGAWTHRAPKTEWEYSL